MDMIVLLVLEQHIRIGSTLVARVCLQYNRWKRREGCEQWDTKCCIRRDAYKMTNSVCILAIGAAEILRLAQPATWQDVHHEQ